MWNNGFGTRENFQGWRCRCTCMERDEGPYSFEIPNNANAWFCPGKGKSRAMTFATFFPYRHHMFSPHSVSFPWQLISVFFRPSDPPEVPHSGPRRSAALPLRKPLMMKTVPAMMPTRPTIRPRAYTTFSVVSGRGVRASNSGGQ